MLTNWSGNHLYSPERIHRPESLDALRRIAATASQLRAVGTRHSFTDVGDARELVILDGLRSPVVVDRGAMTVTVAAGVTYAELATTLNAERLALANLASLPHISVVGAVVTGTHGSGDRLGGLATSVAALELVTSSGDVLSASRDDPWFPGAIVNLGALGIVTRVTLDVEPYYAMRQDVYEDLEWDALSEHWDEITAVGDSVSVFHQFGDRVAQVWVKRRVRVDGDDRVLRPARRDLFGARPARGPHHPVLGGDPANCTPQLGEPGPWSERLPHFRSGFTPSSGAEIQSELLVDRADAIAAIRAVRAHATEIRPLLLTSEIRTIAADELWLSPAYRRETAGLHFTWRRRQADVERVTARIEDVLRPFRPRPHWAKLFAAGGPALAARYPRIDDFRALRAELDPRGTFVNDWLCRRVLSGA